NRKNYFLSVHQYLNIVIIHFLSGRKKKSKIRFLLETVSMSVGKIVSKTRKILIAVVINVKIELVSETNCLVMGSKPIFA
ncbi:hypothetical protein A5806_002500, partial [Enterococcus faecium]